MSKLSQVPHGNRNDEQYQVASIPRSGFNNTYNSHVGGLVIGRVYPSAFHKVMPGSKFSGKTDFQLFAEKLVTPVVSDVNVATHTFEVTYRSIDKDFQYLMTPTKYNGMSADFETPSFSLNWIVQTLFEQWKIMLPQYVLSGATLSRGILLNNTAADYPDWFSVLNSLKNSTLYTTSDSVYMQDAYDDLFEQIKPFWEVIENMTGTALDMRNAFINLWCKIFDFFCGEGSNMDYLGYPIIRHQDVKSYFDLIEYPDQRIKLIPTTTLGNTIWNFEDIFGALGSDSWHYYATHLVIKYTGDVVNQNFDFSDSRRSEYKLRALYAIWFEHYRVDDLMPRNGLLPEYHEFGATPLLSGAGQVASRNINCLLPLRIATWTKDPFTEAQIDDISRHVLVPVLSTELEVGSTVVNEINDETTDVFAWSNPFKPAQLNSDLVQPYSSGNAWSMHQLTWVDVDGVTRNVSTYLPQALSNLGSFTRLHQIGTEMSFDLFSLKKAKMIERFLKRNHAFGDEYHDRMQAQYDVKVSDYAILRPVELGTGSVSRVDIRQEVANTGANPGDNVQGMVDMGTRLATGIAQQRMSDGYEHFSEEFGVVLTLFTITPRAQYNVCDPTDGNIKFVDYPIPVFADQQEEIMNAGEISRVGLVHVGTDNLPFGHVPYAHGYRYRVDEVHGQMLSEKYDFTFCRFYRGMTSDGVPKLNYRFVHCRPNLPMFVNKILLDGQFYGTIKNNFLVEHPLPANVELI